MDKKIDFSKKPEGATHVAVVNSTRVCWYKMRPDRSYEYSYQNDGQASQQWGESHGTPAHGPLIECSSKPAWNGEGLPPVGVVCEVFGCTHKYNIRFNEQKVKIIAHHIDCDGDNVAVFEAKDYEYHGLAEERFRPVRTAEQIAAAAERANACDTIFGILSSVDRAGNRSDMAEALYDAGYRKQ